MGIFLILVGFLVNAVCGVIILIQAFKVSVGWGLAVFFIPFAGLFFVLNHWEDTKKPFLAGVGAAVVMFLGFLMVGKTAQNEATGPLAQQSASVQVVEETSPSQPPVQASIAAAPVVEYRPPRNTYTPSYNPRPEPAPVPAATGTAPAEDEWGRSKPMIEQVYVDRETGQFYSEKCRKRPENAYRVARSVAVTQGMTEAKCR
jgi:hypothetical protein